MELTKSDLRNLSSLHSVLHADFTTSVASTRQNFSQLHDLIHLVERNHSSILNEHSSTLSRLERNSFLLKQDPEGSSTMFVAGKKETIPSCNELEACEGELEESTTMPVKLCAAMGSATHFEGDQMNDDSERLAEGSKVEPPCPSTTGHSIPDSDLGLTMFSDELSMAKVSDDRDGTLPKGVPLSSLP